MPEAVRGRLGDRAGRSHARLPSYARADAVNQARQRRVEHKRWVPMVVDMHLLTGAWVVADHRCADRFGDVGSGSVGWFTAREVGEGTLSLWRCRSDAIECAVDRRASDTEELGQFGCAVCAEVVQFE